MNRSIAHMLGHCDDVGLAALAQLSRCPPIPPPLSPKIHERSQAIWRFIQEHADEPLADIIGDLDRVAVLASQTGENAIERACAPRPDIQDQLNRLVGNADRSLWLFVHHKDLFRIAESYDGQRRCRNSDAWTEYTLTDRVQEVDPDELYEAVSAALAAALKEAFGIATGLDPISFVESEPGQPSRSRIVGSIFLAKRVAVITEVDNDSVARRPLRPVGLTQVIYEPATGLLAIICEDHKGKKKRNAFAAAFAQAMGLPADSVRKVEPREVNWEKFRQRFDFSHRSQPKVAGARVVEVSTRALEEGGGGQVFQMDDGGLDLWLLVEKNGSPAYLATSTLTDAVIEIVLYPEPGERQPQRLNVRLTPFGFSLRRQAKLYERLCEAVLVETCLIDGAPAPCAAEA